MTSLVIVISLSFLLSSCSSQVIDKTSCGSNKTCFGLPADCTIESQNRECDILFSAQADNAGKSIRMELLAKLDNSASKWFAVAFSDDTSMGDDAVFECLVLESQSVDLRQSFNTGKSNKVVSDSTGTSNVRTSLKNGNVYCAWKQNSLLNVRGKTLDLINKQYHLMLAKGPFRSTTGKPRLQNETSFSQMQCLFRNLISFFSLLLFFMSTVVFFNKQININNNPHTFNTG